MKKGVIFDLDGTLIDSLWLWNSLGEIYLKRKNIIDKDIDKECMNKTTEEAAAYMKEKHGLEASVSFINLEINCLIEEYYYNKINLFDGASDFIEYLYAHNFKLIIATDTPKPLAVAALKRLGVWDFFTDVITTIKVRADKSKPDIYDYCCLRMGLNKNEVVVIEDDNMAINTLKKALYDVISYGESYDDSIYHIKSYKDEATYKILEKII